MSKETMTKHYLLASDFDQTLSFNDSGLVLSQLLGIHGFEERVAGLAGQNFVQQGAELNYLLQHDPEFRRVRREQLRETGKRIPIKRNVALLESFLNSLSPQHQFHFYVVSAGPQEVVESALEGIVPPDHIFGTRFAYDPDTGEIRSIVHCSAGYGKVAVLNALAEKLELSKERIIYMGDGSSDIHAMLHVNWLGGLTIAVSENRFIRQVAKRVVLSDDALGVTVPIMEEILGFDSAKIQEMLEGQGFLIRAWEKVWSDSLVILPGPHDEPAEEAAAAGETAAPPIKVAVNS